MNAPDPREMGKWAHRYAQNRSLRVVVMLGIVALLYVVLFWAPPLAARAYQAGYGWLAGLLGVLAVAAMLVTFWFAFFPAASRFVERVTQRLYAGEGAAELVVPRSRRRWWLGVLSAAFLFTGISTSIVLDARGLISHASMQPISALFCVPFLVAVWLLMRPAVSPIALLWPFLYVVHAGLILAGAPIVFTGQWDALNMLIPTAGYGLLSALASHLYSRYALRKLRRLGGGLPEEASEGESA